MDTNVITFLACICFVFLFGKIFIVPLRKILKIVVNSILGGLYIYMVNLVGTNFGFHIGLNFLTSILVRDFGVARCCLFDCCKIVDRCYLIIFKLCSD